MLLLWDVAGFRGRRLEVEGWGDGVILFSKKCVLRIRVERAFRVENALLRKCTRIAEKNALLCFRAKTHMYCIVLADCPHGSWKCSAWKRTFLKPGLRVEKSENTALAFSCGRRICILSGTMTPSPHSSTSSLQPLNPATSHNNNYNNNNNSGLLLVIMFLATYSPCSRVWVAAAVRPH